MKEMMQTKLCLMPAKCVSCEQVFDTSEDFRECEENLAEIECDLKSKQGVLCWDCRRVDTNAKKARKR